jgi:hypothetical protein
MTTFLVPGDLDSSGNLPAGSMARMIDDSLRSLIPLHAGEDPLGRRWLAVAIAHGVIGHLKAQQEAFVVHIPDGGGGYTDSDLSINT